MKKLVVLALVLGGVAVLGFAVVSHTDTAQMVAGRVTAWAS